MKDKSLLMILMIVMLLAACKSDDGDEPISEATSPAVQPTAEEVTGEQTTILFAVYDWEQALYDDLIPAFEEANPDLRVQIVSVNEVLELDPMGGRWPDDAFQRLASAADVIASSGSQQSLARDLMPLMEADPTFQADDFFPGVLESLQRDGGLWTLPTRVSYELIFFDKDAFDEAGVPYPEPGWTWDDFLSRARALTQREGDEIVRWGFVQPWPDHLPFIEGRVGSLIDPSTDPPTPRFDQPEIIEAVRWYANLYLEEQVTPYLELPEPDENGVASTMEGQELIDEGQAAMWRESSDSWQWRKQRFNLGVAPYPVDNPDSHTTPFWAQGLFMSAGTAHPDAAWRWMNFLSRQSIGSGSFSQSLSARRSVAGASGFWDEVDAELADALRYAIDHSYTMQWTTGYGTLAELAEEVLAGAKSVDDALAEAQVQAQAEIQEEANRQAEATPLPTVVVAPPEEKEPPVEGAVTITFIPGLGSFDLQPYRDAARQFQEAHPGIVVEVKAADYYGSGPDLQSMAEQADCFQWFPDLQDPENQAAILSLEPFLDADPSFNTDDFFPSAIEQFTQQGQLWGLPSGMDPYVIEYNKNLFDAAGEDYPALDWNTDDFLTLAVALTQGEDESKQYGFVAQTYEAGDLLLFMGSLGADLLDEHTDPPTLTLNDPTVVEVVRWYASLSTVHGVKPVLVTDLSEMMGSSVYMEREGLISQERAAMWTTSGRSSAFEDERSFDVGVVPLPQGANGARGGSLTSSDGYFISARTEARQACWEWITFLTEVPGVVQGFPARRSVAESQAYIQQVGAERAAAYLASTADAEQSSIYQALTEKAAWLAPATLWLSQAYGQVVKGEASVEQAIEAAQELADNYRACVIAREAISDQAGQEACMKETDPSLPDFLFQTEEE